MKEGEMGDLCIVYGKSEECIQNFDRKEKSHLKIQGYMGGIY
jgi:hypothetical protein